MMSSAPDVDAYIAEAPPHRREALGRLRALCRDALPDAEELILYGMPAYRQEGTLLVAFASQKNHLAIYGCRGAIQRRAVALTGVDRGKGCVRYRKIDAIDYQLWREIFRDVAAHVGRRI
jgi:uncharacterized protein YdhG (YjbR/CyaY superfamily)